MVVMLQRPLLYGKATYSHYVTSVGFFSDDNIFYFVLLLYFVFTNPDNCIYYVIKMKLSEKNKVNVKYICLYMTYHHILRNRRYKKNFMFSLGVVVFLCLDANCVKHIKHSNSRDATVSPKPQAGARLR